MAKDSKKHLTAEDDFEGEDDLSFTLRKPQAAPPQDAREGAINDFLDLSGVTAQSFDPIPVGTYKVLVVATDPYRFSKNDNRMITFQFKVLEPEQYAGRSIWHNLTVTDKTLGIVKTALEAILGREVTGINYTELAAEAQDRVVSVRVGIDDNPGYQPRNVIKAFLALRHVQGPVASQRAGLFERK